MVNFSLYAITVFIWGSTWLAITYQVNVAAIEVSLAYRFGLAAALLFLYCLWKKIPLSFKFHDHFYIAILAAMVFSCNYYFLYNAQLYLSSAMTSIAFSTILVMNLINARLFFTEHIASRSYLGALFGLMGIAALFWHEIQDFSFSDTSIIGLTLALTGTLLASFGNMASLRNSRKGLPLHAVNAWGMAYGTIIMVLLGVWQGSDFNLTDAPQDYWLALLYLSIFGTIIAFGSYFSLLQRIGPAKASYAMVLFPFVAVLLSTLFEDFQWHLSTLLGFLLVIVGNVLVLTAKVKLAFPWRKNNKKDVNLFSS